MHGCGCLERLPVLGCHCNVLLETVRLNSDSRAYCAVWVELVKAASLKYLCYCHLLLLTTIARPHHLTGSQCYSA